MDIIVHKRKSDEIEPDEIDKLWDKLYKFLEIRLSEDDMNVVDSILMEISLEETKQ